jgi:hypothetical protein
VVPLENIVVRKVRKWKNSELGRRRRRKCE